MDEIPSRSQSVFVGRTAETAQLDEALASATDGAGQFLLLVGEAGAGKTALVNDFLGRIHNVDGFEPVVLTARCSYQTGSEDAYSPFRSLIEDLLVQAAGVTTDTTDRRQRTLRRVGIAAARALLEIGPDLLGTIIPGTGIAWRAGQALLGDFLPKDDSPRPSDIPQRITIHERYLQVLESLSTHPTVVLIIVVEDLQWADQSSLDLLSFLVENLAAHRMLVIGTYRHDELIADPSGRTAPLTKIASEAERKGVGRTIDLTALDDADVSAYVAAVFPGHQFGSDLHTWLHERTGGNALFVAQTIRQMREIGHLDNSSGTWRESRTIPRPEYLPRSVEAVIEDRIQRLQPRWLKLLECASVEGTEFAAQVVAAVVEEADHDVVDELVDSLQRRHDLVHEQGERPLTSRQMLSLFHFTHSAIRRYLYERYLVPAQRRRLHGRVGRALEQLHEGHTDLIAPILAYHFVESRDTDKAIYYLLKAADKALAARGMTEAQSLFGRAAYLAGDSLETGVISDINAFTSTGDVAHARTSILRWTASIYGGADSRLSNAGELFALPSASAGPGSRVNRHEILLEQVAAAVQPYLTEESPGADELYQLLLRTLMYVSELAMPAQNRDLYPLIRILNDLISGFLELRGDELASAFRRSYVAWIAENLMLDPQAVTTLAQRAASRFREIYEHDIAQATDAIEAAAFNASRARLYETAAAYYSDLCRLLPLSATSLDARTYAHADIAYNWLAARNRAWAADRDTALAETQRQQLRSEAADLFGHVARVLCERTPGSVSAPLLYQRAIDLLPADDSDRRQQFGTALEAIRERNATFGQPRYDAAIVGETYDKAASEENPLADCLLTWLLERGVRCVRECPSSREELLTLGKTYDLILMQSGPRSPWPQGRLVWEVFAQEDDFHKLYLARESFCQSWVITDEDDTTWVLFAGNGVLRTMDAAADLIASGRLEPVLEQCLRRSS